MDSEKKMGRPQAEKKCETCGLTMSARDLHYHYSDCRKGIEERAEDERFERVWNSETFRSRFIDQNYYDRDVRSLVPSSLAILARVSFALGRVEIGREA